VFSLPKHTELLFSIDVEKSGMFQDVYHLVSQMGNSGRFLRLWLEQVMRSKLLMMTGMAIVGLLTACGLKAGGGAKVAVPPILPASLPGVPISRPPALPNPTLIAPGGAAALGNNIGGRPDPFSALPLTPTVVVKQNPDPVVPSIAPSIISFAPVQPPNAAVAQQPVPIASTPMHTVNVPATVAPVAVPLPVVVAPIAPPAAAPAPTIREAQAIAVSGVVQAGSRTSIIVRVPNETSSRYAVVGDYLANGQVLVKRIEMQGAEPLVVLEQDGAEFIKPVGSGG
jgi:hypothetical protein